MADMDTRGARRRKRWPEALKREIVAATLAPGASVSVVARQYDVNANQVFSWRRRYREDLGSSSSVPPTSGLVAVTIAPEPETEIGASSPAAAASETIEIEVSGGYRVRVGSSFDGRALKRVLDVLRRR
jgi:transposase